MDFNLELKKLGIDINENKNQLFKCYYNKLIETNKIMNLTTITKEEDVYRKHFLDSLELFRVLDLDTKYNLCDVGSGAGFPSIPLAIIDSNINVTIIDALNKRINFLNELINELGLDNARAFHFRAEDYVKEKKEFFDVVTARAVARLNILTELCLPLTKIGGLFIAMKAVTGSEELTESKNAISVLGGEILEVIDFELPEEDEKRQIIVIKKIKSTPVKYPRNFNKIKEKPL